MEERLIDMVLAAIKGYGVSGSAIVTGSACGFFSWFSAMLIAPGQYGLAAALSICGSALGAIIVAYFKHRPATIQAASAAKIAESTLLSNQASMMITRAEKRAAYFYEVSELQKEARHEIAGLLTPLSLVYDFVADHAKKSGLGETPTIPNIGNQIRARNKQLDDEIKELRKRYNIVELPPS